LGVTVQQDQRRIRVAVLGGGVGAITAAAELSATADLRAKYAVTVYQQGWRLGGKGASGRNAAAGQRIEEHGLHMWLGFYQNAFAMIREIYAEWDKAPDNPFQKWSDAFTAQSNISLGEHKAGGWDFWQIPLPPLPGTPGDGGHLTLPGMAEALIEWLVSRHAELGAAGAHRAAQQVHGHLLSGAWHLIEDTVAAVRGELSTIGQDLGRLLELLEIGWAVFKGLVSDVLPKGHDGLRSIDHLDFRDWLISHGCPHSAAHSAPIKALYDLGFAYRDGDSTKPQAAAGVALYVMLSMGLGARGAVIYRMNAGMGDTIFSPLYQVLKARGVAFEFFHRVEALHLSPDGNLVQSIDLNRQVDLAGAGYDPLVDVAYGTGKVLPCWPSAPRWDQVQDGAAVAAKLAAEQLNLENIWCQQSVGTRRLKLGADFDHVVLGISLAGLKGTCDELIAAHPPFAAMVQGIATVQTQALQLWLNRDTAGMGWAKGQTVLTSYADPHSTWADMSHLLTAETWPGEGPKGIAYFCGPLADSAIAGCLTKSSPPACATAVATQIGTDWLNANAPAMWPAAVAAGGFDWQTLYDPAGGTGPARLTSQYVRANIDPSERYVLSVPGTVHLRLESGNSGFANLFLAGDWTQTRMNSGCVEAAVESGMRAAQAISGYPKTIFGSGLEG
jgi:uncharacterized protein with NAD-binding domain and iron-sulfur cluster